MVIKDSAKSIQSIQSKRIDFFDTAKGILMLFLIWGHVIFFASSFGVENDYFQYVHDMVPFYRVFFMQTFFLITGYCTSWHVRWPEFLKKNLKTIIWPAFVFLPFDFLAQVVTGREFSLASFTYLGVKYVISGIPWFLGALFIAKTLFYFINRYLNLKAGIILLIILFEAGLFAAQVFYLSNPWAYQQAFVMIPFLGLGQILRNLCGEKLLAEKYLFLVALPYFGVMCLWRYTGLAYPAVDAYVEVSPVTAPAHIILALSGSALILLVSKYAAPIGFLNLMGRQSLFIYLAHNLIAIVIIDIIKKFYPDFLSDILLFPSVYILTVMVSIAGCKAMDTRYLRWMTGRF